MNRRRFLSWTAATSLRIALARPAAGRDWGNLPHYPDTDIKALDKRFTFDVRTGAIERIATDCRWCVGPVHFR